MFAWSMSLQCFWNFLNTTEDCAPSFSFEEDHLSVISEVSCYSSRASFPPHCMCKFGDQERNQMGSCRAEMLEKFRKERNLHRMHHCRIAQEKNKLIVDLKVNSLLNNE
jgi:hypothetical protein